jgi:hypothetical protein
VQQLGKQGSRIGQTLLTISSLTRTEGTLALQSR